MGFVLAGVGLSAFVFSTIANTFFPGDPSGFLLTLAVGTAAPMALGWLFVRPCPHREHLARMDIERHDQCESENASPIQNEATLLITKSDPVKRRDLNSLAMVRTIDFWLLFWTMSFRECLRHGIEGY
jgi:hypothetical protein